MQSTNETSGYKEIPQPPIEKADSVKLLPDVLLVLRNLIRKKLSKLDFRKEEEQAPVILALDAISTIDEIADNVQKDNPRFEATLLEKVKDYFQIWTIPDITALPEGEDEILLDKQDKILEEACDNLELGIWINNVHEFNLEKEGLIEKSDRTDRESSVQHYLDRLSEMKR